MGTAQKPDPTPCRVVVVDDHPIVRAGLSSLIDAEPDLAVCGQAENAREALGVIERERPDLVLVDLSLRDSSGLELIKQLASRQVKVLVVSMHDEATWSERTIAAGALGFVHKSNATREIVLAIRRVMAGRLYVSESIGEQLLRKMIGGNLPGSVKDPVATLSDRELEIFQRIGEGKTTQEIGEALCLSPKTVQTYRQRIKQKIGSETAADLSSQATRWVVESSKS